MSIKQNVEFIKEKISAAAQRGGKSAEDITLIAVSKTVDVLSILEATNAGICNLGENKVQELTDKFSHIKNVNWHLIGHLQTNKVKYVVDKAFLIHSVDSVKLAQEIDKYAKKAEKQQNILIQLNLTGEKTKFGIHKDELDFMLENMAKLSNIKACGLMAISNPNDTEAENKKMYEICNKLFVDNIQKNHDNICMQYLSMGMSNDFEIAIEMGANMVRIGTGIFGRRIYQ